MVTVYIMLKVGQGLPEPEPSDPRGLAEKCFVSGGHVGTTSFRRWWAALFPLRRLSSSNYLPPGRLLSTFFFWKGQAAGTVSPPPPCRSPFRISAQASQLRGEIYLSFSSQRKMSSLVTRVAFCPSFSAPNAERSGRLACKCHRSL